MANQQTTSTLRLLRFYLGKEPDHQGRWIDEIWEWDYSRLEQTHDYIQWLFPLKEKSGFNPNAPTLTDELIQAFRAREDLRERLLRSLDVMLAFYGLRRSEAEGHEIVRSDEYEVRQDVWVRYSNHNHLRLTRIMTSLKLLGLAEYSKALFYCLDEIFREDLDRISPDAYAHWIAAGSG